MFIASKKKIKFSTLEAIFVFFLRSHFISHRTVHRMFIQSEALSVKKGLMLRRFIGIASNPEFLRRQYEIFFENLRKTEKGTRSGKKIPQIYSRYLREIKAKNVIMVRHIKESRVSIVIRHIIFNYFPLKNIKCPRKEAMSPLFIHSTPTHTVFLSNLSNVLTQGQINMLHQKKYQLLEKFNVCKLVCSSISSFLYCVCARRGERCNEGKNELHACVLVCVCEQR